jgi:hypothetical protein
MKPNYYDFLLDEMTRNETQCSEVSRDPKGGVPKNSEQFEKLKLALSKRFEYLQDRPPRPGDEGRMVEHLERRARYRLAACNPYSGDLWARYLYEAFLEHEPGKAFALTIFHPNFDRGVPKTKFLKDPHCDISHDIASYETRLRSVLRRWPFIMMLDLALHRLPRESSYRMLPHHHGIIFGNKEQIRTGLGRAMGNSLAGAPIYKLKDIYDLKGWLDYVCKDPRCMYVTVPPEKDGLATFHHRERLFSSHQLYLLDLYGPYTKPELCVGSGTGSKIRRRANQLAERWGWAAEER